MSQVAHGLSVDASLLTGGLCISIVVGVTEFYEVQFTDRSFATTQRARASYILPSVVEKRVINYTDCQSLMEDRVASHY